MPHHQFPRTPRLIERRRLALTCWAVTALLAWGSPATGFAQTQTAYPNRPINMVVNFAAGGATDLVARALADQLREVLGQPVVVENLTGASTSIGTAKVARAAKDGYTLLFSTNSTFTITPLLQPRLEIKLEEFQPIARIGSIPYALSTRKDFPAATLDEFIAAAKAKPKGVSNGTPGIGSVPDILGRYAYKRFGVANEGIHYRGEALAIPDLLAGRTDTQFVSVAVAAQHLQTGGIRVLATTGMKRSSVLPSTPTLAELGYPDIFGESWQIVMAPAGTPAPVVARLSAAIDTVLKNPAFTEKIAKFGAEAAPAAPPEILRLLSEEHRRWGAVIAENRITVE